jgi:hypothetical protein
VSGYSVVLVIELLAGKVAFDKKRHVERAEEGENCKGDNEILESVESLLFKPVKGDEN